MGFWEDEAADYDAAFDDMPDEGTNVPDGNYEVTVQSVECMESKTSGQPMVKWALKIDGPKYAGRYLWRYNMVTTETNQQWLKKDLAACGIKCKLSELPSVAEEMVGMRLLVKKKTNGNFENVYITKLLDGTQPPVSPDAVLPAKPKSRPARGPAETLDPTPDSGDDEIPF